MNNHDPENDWSCAAAEAKIRHSDAALAKAEAEVSRLRAALAGAGYDKGFVAGTAHSAAAHAALADIQKLVDEQKASDASREGGWDIVEYVDALNKLHARIEKHTKGGGG